ncbi:MAG: hypothetical protein FWG27_09045 [Treponema sp.]|nr:hypothetical protein [Treponema sp.]
MNGFFIGFALALLLWFSAFLYLKSFVRRRTSPDHILTLLQEEVRQLEADIDEKTEQDLQLLEEKISVLREACAKAEQICTETERRIAVYGRELERREKENEALTALDMPSLLEGLRVTSSQQGGMASGGGAFVKQAETAYRAQTARQQPSQPSAAQQPAPDQSVPVPQIALSRKKVNIKPPPIKDRIAELHRAGLAPELIAKRLGINLGEVTLYFNMADTPESR